ncbi:hypothetical protein ACFSM5_01955 [Lacibacterium aquatile]|uniref:Uncharacterized protein n=1 Tax=Lacibacterium aquatile TaxID=1168082 RepID=A0ABW5DKK0_9PROT
MRTILALTLALATLPTLVQAKDFAIAINSHGDPVRNRKGGEALIAGCPGLQDNIDGIFGVSVWDKGADGKDLQLPIGWSEAVRVVVRTRPDFKVKDARNKVLTFLVGGNEVNGGFLTRDKTAAPLCIMDIARTGNSTQYLKSLPANPLR